MSSIVLTCVLALFTLSARDSEHGISSRCTESSTSKRCSSTSRYLGSPRRRPWARCPPRPGRRRSPPPSRRHYHPRCEGAITSQPQRGCSTAAWWWAIASHPGARAAARRPPPRRSRVLKVLPGECRSSPPWPPRAGSRGSWPPRCAPGTSRRAAQGPMGGCGVAMRPGQSRQSRGLQLTRHGRSPAAAARRTGRRQLVITPRPAAPTRRRRGPPRLPAGLTISTAARPHGQIGLQPGMHRVTGSIVSTAALSLTKPVALAAAAPGCHPRLEVPSRARRNARPGSGLRSQALVAWAPPCSRAAPQPRSPAALQPCSPAALQPCSPAASPSRRPRRLLHTASHILLQPPSPVVAGVSPVLSPNIARPAAAGAGANDWGGGGGGGGGGSGGGGGGGGGGGESGGGGGVALPSSARSAAQVQQQRLEQMRNSHRRQV